MGGPCDFSVSPSPFGLDFETLDFGTSDSGLTKIVTYSKSSDDENKNFTLCLDVSSVQPVYMSRVPVSIGSHSSAWGSPPTILKRCSRPFHL